MKKSQPQEASQESRGRAVGPEEAAPPQRWSARLKAEVAIRLIRGESLDALSRETRQPAARLTEWREEFLAGGAEALKSRRDDPVEEAHADERRRLQAKIGELAMDNELLYERCHKLEAGLPPGRRKSKR